MKVAKVKKTDQMKYSWEETVAILRKNPDHQKLIFNSYLTENLMENCCRFLVSTEFESTKSFIHQYAPTARDILDMPAGNGIATYAFAKSGYRTTAVEPDPSTSVGRGAIELVMKKEGLSGIKIVSAFGEKLPFCGNSFDIVYVRQGLHHARDLPAMVRELARVLRPNGMLFAAREHVVDNYGRSLKAFLDSQVDHQLYGGENAFTLTDYKSALACAGLELIEELGPYDSPINMFPNDPESLRERITTSLPGQLLRRLLPRETVARIGMWYLRRSKRPGRAYTFLARKQ